MTSPTKAKEPSLAEPETSVSTVEFIPGLYADIHAPPRPGPYPVVTLSYGGGWSSGSRTQLSPLARYLAASGIVAVNADYHHLSADRHILHLVQEVACVAAAAPLLAQPHLTVKAGPVWMLGFSSGAHLATLASLSTDILPWTCPQEPSEVKGVIGMGGPYEVDHFWMEANLATMLPEGAEWLEGRQKSSLESYFRSLLANVPEHLWHFLDPMDIAANHPPLRFLLLAGGSDNIVPPFYAENFAAILNEAGHLASWEIVADADHIDLVDPLLVGEQVATFLGRHHR